MKSVRHTNIIQSFQKVTCLFNENFLIENKHIFYLMIIDQYEDLFRQYIIIGSGTSL